MTSHRRQAGIAIIVALLLSLGAVHPVHAQYAPVAGEILSAQTNAGVPGLTASLIHPQLGRSAPSFTDGYGNFGWTAIPLRPEPYFLEIYWGNNLIYRQQLVVQGPVYLPPLHF